MDTARTKAGKTERDREMTETRLIDAVGALIAEDGFEALGVRRVAERAGVNKTLIYRYFDSLDGLIVAYMKKHDFWLNMASEKPDTSDIKAYMKGFYRRQIADFRTNIALKRLRRWELSSDKEFVADVRARREKAGVQFLETMAGFTKMPGEQLQAIAALVDAGIAYLAMFEDNCRMYNGIDIQSDRGWEQIAGGIDALIDIMVK
jgi:AcrR family transcriptional regulator